jgi:hypothetical protein
MVNISEATFYAWKASDAEFFEAIERAKEGRVAFLLSTIIAASKRSWQAAAWLLERTLPQRFSRSVKVAGDPDGAPVNVDMTTLSTDELRRMIKHTDESGAKTSS